MSHKFPHRFINLFLVLAIALAGTSSVLAGDGSLDPTFGVDGKVTTDFGSGNDNSHAVAYQPDGKIVVAGESWNGSDSDFALTRYNSDGSLDVTFDNDGKVTTDISNSYLININTASAAQLQALPGIGPVTAQKIVDYRNEHGPFQRIEDIINITGIGPGLFNIIKDLITVGNDYGYAVAIQPDGKIIVAGNSSANFALARYGTDGSLDTTFDIDGMLMTAIGSTSNDYAQAVALQPDGKIVVTGFSFMSGAFEIALARYNSDGSLDTTFDTDGIVTTSISEHSGADFGRAIAVQPDGKIIVAGESFVLNVGYTFALLRYNSDGSLDTSFGVDGILTTTFGDTASSGTAVTLQPDGKIVVAGGSGDPDPYDFALARYNSDGSLDTTFDIDGKVTTDFGNDDFGSAIALQPDGKIVVAGGSGNTDLGDFALARYNSDGSLDTTFDIDGKVTTDFSTGNDFGSAIALQPDGKIVVAGNSFNGSNFDFALARYDAAISALEVTIDIKPGRPQNRIEVEKNVCKDDDNLRVAILTTPDFDAQTVDASTVKLGDPLLSGTVSPVRNRLRDVDLDGDMDMVLAFPLCDLVTNEALNVDSTELVLIGTTLDSLAITGRDSVKVVHEDD